MAANPSLEDTVTTQAWTPTLPSTDQSQSFPFFPSLPPEIRQLVWFFTFSPRIVQIQIHSKTAPDNATRSGAIHFTASEDLIAIPSSYVKIERLSPIEDRPGALQASSTYVPSPALSRPYPRGPTALHVCRESREVALNHYELAFGGVNLQPREDVEYAKAWREEGFAEKKIWVNFKIDLIAILDHANISPTHISMKPNHPVYYMAQYAKDETRKIQRLAVSECWYTASHPARAQRRPHFFVSRPVAPDHPTHGPGYFDDAIGSHRDSATSYLRKILKDFKNIKELEVYVIGGRPVPIFVNRLLVVENNFLEEDMAPWRERLRLAFELEREITPEWTADLPVITVRKGLHGLDDCWDGTFLT